MNLICSFFNGFSVIIFSLTALLITDDITKQRALEAMENEIVNNLIQANNTVDANNKAIKNNVLPNFFYNYNTYSNNVWNNPLTLQYFDQLEPSIQEKIVGYYAVYVRDENADIVKLSSLTSTYLQVCYPALNTVQLDEQTMNNCKIKYNDLLGTERNIAVTMSNQSFLFLKYFHPTKDRLSNWFLRLIMGNKGLPILVLPQKPSK